VTTRPTVRAANGSGRERTSPGNIRGSAALRRRRQRRRRGVAAAAVCAVVMPHRTSMGGDMFALVYDTSSRRDRVQRLTARAAAQARPRCIRHGLSGARRLRRDRPGADRGLQILSPTMAVSASIASCSGDRIRREWLSRQRRFSPGRSAKKPSGSRTMRRPRSSSGPRGRWAAPERCFSSRSRGGDSGHRPRRRGCGYRGDFGERFGTPRVDRRRDRPCRPLRASHRSTLPSPSSIGAYVSRQPPVSAGAHPPRGARDRRRPRRPIASSGGARIHPSDGERRSSRSRIATAYAGDPARRRVRRPPSARRRVRREPSPGREREGQRAQRGRIAS